MSKKEKRTAQEELVRYLGTRMRTVTEARNHLTEKGYETPKIQEAIERFLQLGYLDDADYARAYCEYAYGKGRGRIRIAAELKQRGVDSETVQNAIEDYLYEAGVDELSLARKQAEKILAEEFTPALDPKREARVARKLEQQGYSTSIILRVLGEIRIRRTP